MKLLKRVFFILMFLLLVLIGVAYLLPREATAERSIVIDRPPATVYTVLAGLDRFNEWSPWYGRDPAATYDFSGPAWGSGASMRWQGNEQVGEGSYTIVATEAFERIDVSLDFGPQGIADTWYTLTPVGDGTRVNWGFRTDLGLNPAGRYFGLLMDRFVGNDYEQGLAKLKTLVEGLPAADFGPLQASETEVQPQAIVYVRQRTATDAPAISAGYAAGYMQLLPYMAENDLRQAAPPIGIEIQSGPDEYVFDAAIPVDAQALQPAEPIQFGHTPAGAVVRVTHVGDYAGLTGSVEALSAFLAARGHRGSGPVWFVFVDDPTQVAADAVRTEIYQRYE
ncbi:MAG: SRPBCC family protein [Xanthomonadales bacterium]|nr:SRPBCC family protein [Xanthomonadales bacterium]